MDRTKILANLPSLTKEQLWDEIQQGNVKLSDLINSGCFPVTDERHKWIKTKIVQLDSKDDEAWQKILDKAASGAKLTISDYTEYIAAFNDGKHRAEADSAIAEIVTKEHAAKRDRQQKLDNIKKDRNCCRPETVLQDIRSDIYSIDDLIHHCNFPEKIANKITQFRPLQIELGETPDSIPEGFTEVYFWGVINSGKTCALSAILKTAEIEGYLQTGFGSGLSYLNDLKNLFKDDNIGFLPEGTRAENTQYLPFTLQKISEKGTRSISLIELSGEVFQCFVNVNERKEIPENLKETFNTLTSYLKGNNRKIHFFFIDYNPEAISAHSRTQSDYMSEATKWIEQNRIFKNKTDAIYVVVTKSDMIDGYFDPDKTELERNIDDFLERKFKAFRQNLKQICINEAINNRDFEIIPFSIGDVYLTRICDIDTEPSKRIINRLFRIQPQKRSILDLVIQ
jgi:hypothetical protein